jgi:Family of unknown function (DUF6311)
LVPTPHPLLKDMALGAVIGAIAALIAFEPRFIAGSGPKWANPGGDLVAYLVAWNYFIHDQWRLPVFALPMMGYPEGGSVLFNDAIPLAAFLTKVLFSLTGWQTNPFGLWLLVSFSMQGAFGARLARALGIRSSVLVAAVATLMVCSTGFLTRPPHIAVSTHFLILWALALYFEDFGRGQFNGRSHILLSVVALLTNFYLFAMVIAIQAATLLIIWSRVGSMAIPLRLLILSGLAAFPVMLLAGYGDIFLRQKDMGAFGFGYHSWNVPTLVVPSAVLGHAVPMVRDATKGQYEGEAYIGDAALVLMILCILSSPRAIAIGVWRHRWLVALLLAFGAVAASNQVYFGSILVLSYRLPDYLVAVLSAFRSGGRFIWPVSYLLIAIPIAGLSRRWPRWLLVPIVAVALTVQVHREALPYLQLLRAWSEQPERALIDATRMTRWMRSHDRIWQFRSLWCGGLQAGASAGQEESRRELQLQLLASKLYLPMNSIYMSRALKDCSAEVSWGEAPKFEPGVLYFIGKPVLQSFPALARIAVPPSCLDIDWAVVCSLGGRL